MHDPIAAGAGALEVGDLQIGILSDVYLSGVWVASLDRFARLAQAMGARASGTGMTVQPTPGDVHVTVKGMVPFGRLHP